MNQEKKESIIRSGFFLKLFGIPTIVWILLSLIAMLPDESDPEPLLWSETIEMDAVIILAWFAVSYVIALIIHEIKKVKPKTRIIREVQYVTNPDDRSMIASDEVQEEIEKKHSGGYSYVYVNHKDAADSRDFQGERRSRHPNCVKTGMMVLFILTLVSQVGALYSAGWINMLHPQHGFNFTKNMWVFWCWLPIPLLSILLGIKYKKAGFPCMKNIVGGFIIGFELLCFGVFCLIPSFSQDYNEIDVYRNIIDADLPENGELEIWEDVSNIDEDKTEYVVINVYYDDEDVTGLVNSIENSQNWILSKEIKSELKIFLPMEFLSGDEVYYSIYNKTMDLYNMMPEAPGNYEIYAMRYDNSIKQLEIHKYMFSYK